MRDIFLSKIETKINDIRKLSHESLISQLINSNDYYVNLRRNISKYVHLIVLSNERQSDLTLIIWNIG